MLICMRTTLNIDDHLMLRLKREAIARRTTLTQLISEALARGLEARPAPAEPYHFHIFADAPPLPVDIADRNALEDWLDAPLVDGPTRS